MILAKHLQIFVAKILQKFKVTSKNGNIEIALPLHERSFEFLGRLFFEFEKLNI